MTDAHDTERWMSTLAGKQPADDDNTRQAAQLRQAMLTDTDESDQPMNEASLRRVMNRLEAQGAFADPPASAKRSTSWSARIALALFGDRSWSQAGYAAVAMAVVAVMVGPTLLSHRAVNPDDDGAYTKQVQIDEVQRIHASNPVEAAAQLTVALQQQGLSPEVRAIDGQQQVTAQVPAAQRARVEPGLMELGLSLPADGRLAVVFVAVPADGATKP